MVSRVTAVVLTYDGRDLLDILIPSLRAQRYSDMSIVIVDNGSSDGTAGHVNERWPDARLIEIPVNIGVAAALNRGVRAADGEYVALLNNDLELEPTGSARLSASSTGIQRRPRPPASCSTSTVGGNSTPPAT